MKQPPSHPSRLADARATMQLAWPIMVTQLAQIGSAFVDSTMAGHYSAVDLAAISVGGSIWVALMVTLLGLTLAINPLVAHRVGAKEHHAIPGIVQQGLWQGLAFAVAGMVLAWLIAPFFSLSGLDAEGADKATRFLRAVVWGLPALAFHRVLAGYSASLNCTRPMMFIALFGLALNVPVNWVLIYGKFGFPELGGVGCGYATAFCMWVSAVLLAAWVRWAPIYRETQPLGHWQAPQTALQKQLFRLGLPIGMLFLVEVSAFSLVALLIARLGNTQVAAHQIALNFTGIVFMIPSALGHALTVRVGHALGAGNPQQARLIGTTGIVMGLVYAVFSALLIGLGREGITALYTSDEAVRSLAMQLLFYAAIFQLGDATQTIMAGILRGYKITKWPMLVYICAFWLLGIPLGYALAFGYGQDASGFWQALVLALALAAGLLYGLFVRESHRLLRA
ncbi:multidrug resistance protein, MATE family [Formivibrio citricus]|uniref:Multidrug-efflux transporter n=1 Tax=Formivibrio citricus TaxID=83765 RepID=A0A1I4XR25_9NEIS|nr:MATE family efflux transporter [Formivibrio citricus]SFN28237.1 multidrug resistance protein, MATE family [Formivibrio citricus]